MMLGFFVLLFVKLFVMNTFNQFFRVALFYSVVLSQSPQCLDFLCIVCGNEELYRC